MVVVMAKENLISALLHLRLQFHGEALTLSHYLVANLCFILG